MPYNFSPSSLNLLKDCPRCFWLQFNKEIKRPRGIFPSLPSGMDRVLKIHFDSFLGKKELPPEISHLLRVKLFEDTLLLRKWRNNFQGITWSDEKGNLLRGAVDNILQKEEKLIVLDYKTRGYPIRNDTQEHYRDQMDFYNFLLRKNGFQTENYSYLLFYHPSKVNERGEVVFNTDLVKMTVDVENAEQIFKKALKVLAGNCPQNNGCEWCKNTH